MTHVSRVRTTCSGCHTSGRFTPIEMMLRAAGAWEWRQLALCAVCRLHLVELHRTGQLLPVMS